MPFRKRYYYRRAGAFGFYGRNRYYKQRRAAFTRLQKRSIRRQAVAAVRKRQPLKTLTYNPGTGPFGTSWSYNSNLLTIPHGTTEFTRIGNNVSLRHIDLRWTLHPPALDSVSHVRIMVLVTAYNTATWGGFMPNSWQTPYDKDLTDYCTILSDKAYKLKATGTRDGLPIASYYRYINQRIHNNLTLEYASTTLAGPSNKNIYLAFISDTGVGSTLDFQATVYFRDEA